MAAQLRVVNIFRVIPYYLDFLARARDRSLMTTSKATGRSDATEGLLQRRLRERLMALRRTPRSVSIDAGLSPDALRMILSGRSQNPRSDTLAALAEVLDCDVRYLMGATDVAPAPRSASLATTTSFEADQALLVDLRSQISNALRVSIDRFLNKLGEMPDYVSEEFEKTNRNSFQVLVESAYAFGCITSMEHIQLKLFERATDASDAANLPIDHGQLKYDLGIVIQSLTSQTDPEEIRAAVRIWALAFSAIIRSPTRTVGARAIVRELTEAVRDIDTEEMLELDRQVVAARAEKRAADSNSA
jgi:transcriptional regulator with XRE-family HTH domain